MDKTHVQILDGLRNITRQPHAILQGKVVSVDEGAGTISVVLSRDEDQEAATEGVLLTAVSGDMNGVLMIPAVNSYVVIAQVEGNGNYSLVKAASIDKYKVAIGNSVLTVTADGYAIERSGESLTKLFKDLLNAIAAATYTNGAGTTSPANNLSTFQNILTRINNLLI